jgi:hypothetical protein
MFRSRLHTVRDIDGGNPPISALGGRREPDEMSQPRFNFGGANYGLPQPQQTHKPAKDTFPGLKHSAYQLHNGVSRKRYSPV